MAKKKTTLKSNKPKTIKEAVGTENILRFSHPFFTEVPPSKRDHIMGAGKRMTDFVSTKLEQIPKPLREPSMHLAEIIGDTGAAEIEAFGSITFHTVGDTGQPVGEAQTDVAEAMAKDYNPLKPQKSPAFLLHLGDVVYYANTEEGYHEQFYVPYKKYPGKIIAIPGNHDGELFKWDHSSTGQKKTLEAFMNNFCQPKPGIPPAAGTVFREMVSQPGVYWVLHTPFADLIGLYSNIAEGPGFIEGADIGQEQKNWLIKTLVAIRKARETGPTKALVIAVHHPPFSSGGHASSTGMLNDIDDACVQGGIMPHALIAGHAHSYQRYTRSVNSKGKILQIPYLVAGCGGRGVTKVPKADGTKKGDITFDRSLMGYGFLTVTANPKQLIISFTQVQGEKRKLYDRVKVNLKTGKLMK